MVLPRYPGDDSLCCCEYINREGQRSHVLACCCNCEAVDEAAERCLTCQGINNDLTIRILNVVDDRCRCPGFKGAVKMPLEVAIPLFIVPISLYLGSLHPILTVLSIFGSPGLILLSYCCWSRSSRFASNGGTQRTRRPRTRIFFIWGLMSAVCYFIVYFFIVTVFRSILLYEHLIVFTLFVVTMHFLNLMRRDAGAVHSNQSSNTADSQSFRHRRARSFDFQTRGEFQTERDRRELEFERQQQSPMGSSDWCSLCHSAKPPRGGHCTVCGVCVAGRDHHCVWIDNCVGAKNHRSFFLGLTCAIIGGFYALNLTLCTICTPELYSMPKFEVSIMLPSDCRFLFNDPVYALLFSSSVHCACALAALSFAWLYQALLISQNCTQQELYLAGNRVTEGPTVSWGLFMRNNPHNQGLLRNWLVFITSRRCRVSQRHNLV